MKRRNSRKRIAECNDKLALDKLALDKWKREMMETSEFNNSSVIRSVVEPTFKLFNEVLFNLPPKQFNLHCNFYFYMKASSRKFSFNLENGDIKALYKKSDESYPGEIKDNSRNQEFVEGKLIHNLCLLPIEIRKMIHDLVDWDDWFLHHMHAYRADFHILAFFACRGYIMPSTISAFLLIHKETDTPSFFDMSEIAQQEAFRASPTTLMRVYERHRAKAHAVLPINYYVDGVSQFFIRQATFNYRSLFKLPTFGLSGDLLTEVEIFNSRFSGEFFYITILGHMDFRKIQRFFVPLPK